MSILFRKCVLLFALLILPLAGCQAGSQDRSAGSQAKLDPVQEANEIMGLEREWSRRFQAKDIDWIMTLFTDDTRQFPPGAEPVVGLKALREAWEALAHTKGQQIIWEPTEARVSASNDLAYDFGTAVIFTPSGQRNSGKYLVVWTRQDGAWKVAVDMFSENGSTAQ